MLINVPVAEAKNKLGCGPTSLSMVLKYFHKDYSEKQILKQLKIGLIKDQDRGTLVIDHALFARKLGFEVVCYSYNMELYKPYFIKLSESKLLTELNKLLRKKQTAVNKKILSVTSELIKSGANFKIKMPNLKDITNFLKKKLPVILAVNAKILFEAESLPDFPKVPNNMGHFIVMTGFRNNTFYYNDPYFGKRKKISRDKLFFAWSNNVLDSSAYLLVLLP
jgi:ABC-type bacteriocin/lantibiotic exporter with double-glycine peptidase domain